MSYTHAKPRAKVFRITIVFLVAVLLQSCSLWNVDDNGSDTHQFSGRWTGVGEDSNGNSFSFVAIVNDLGNNKYKILIMDKFDTDKKPFHTIEGVLSGNRFVSSSDGGKYHGGGVISSGVYEGFYTGPVSGKYTMKLLDDESKTDQTSNRVKENF